MFLMIIIYAVYFAHSLYHLRCIVSCLVNPLHKSCCRWKHQLFQIPLPRPRQAEFPSRKCGEPQMHLQEPWQVAHGVRYILIYMAMVWVQTFHTCKGHFLVELQLGLPLPVPSAFPCPEDGAMSDCIYSLCKFILIYIPWAIYVSCIGPLSTSSVLTLLRPPCLPR